MPRESDYSLELADSICERLENGESMRAICLADDMPDRRTIERWMDQKPEFAAKCARAREEQAEFHHSAMDVIEADTLSGGLNPQAASVVLANKRWRMEKLKPKVYGAKLDLAHSGHIANSTPEEMSKAEILARLAELDHKSSEG